MIRNHQLGRWGEDLAAQFLEACGYRCLERQYRRAGGEIDLIVRQGLEVVFVEVKIRSRSSPAPAEAWVDGRKLHRMRQLARRWLCEQQDASAQVYRFDVVAIDFLGDDKGLRLKHFRSVC